LSFENEHLQQQLIETESQLKRAMLELEEMRQIRDENIRLKAQIESSKDHESRLQGLIDRLTQRIEDLTLQAGREYGRGIMDTLREQGHLGGNK
jgi:hypothetical protein